MINETKVVIIFLFLKRVKVAINELFRERMTVFLNANFFFSSC